jgi:hypothetical protein
MHGCFLLNRTSVLLLWIPFSETPVGEADTFPYRSKAFVIGYGLGCGVGRGRGVGVGLGVGGGVTVGVGVGDVGGVGVGVAVGVGVGLTCGQLKISIDAVGTPVTS